MSGNAVFFTVDERLLPMALATASALVEEENRNFDVLVLLQGRVDPALRIPKGVEVRENRLARLLPAGAESGRRPYGVAHTRILAPAALSEEYARLLYLDADVAAFRPVSRLFDLDMRSMPLAAVEGMMDESAPLQKIDLRAYKMALGITDGRVFNSGVLLIDTAAWRALDHDRTLADYRKLRSRQTTPGTGLYGDQDYLNYAMRGRWLGLSPAWNFQTVLLRYALEQLIDPALVHYTGARRPWEPRVFAYGMRHIDFYSSRLAAVGLDAPAAPIDRRRVAADHLRRFVYGIATSKLRRMFDEWKVMRNAFKEAIARRIERGEYQDVEQGLSPIDLRQDPFDQVTFDEVCYYRGHIRLTRTLYDAVA